MKKRTIALFLLAHLLLVVFIGAQKTNYHIDELYTFTLANRYGARLAPDITDGQVYSGDGMFGEYLTVQPEHTSDYGLVYQNQRNDAHPFLYYSFIHTLCSFFPNTVSKWFGLIPNYLFMLAEDVLLYCVAVKLFRRKGLALLATAAVGTTLLTLDTVDFIRMYVLMTVFTVGVGLLLVSYYHREPDRKFWVRLFLLSMGGALTQYYFLIYLFFICLYFGVHLLVHKQTKTALRFIRNMTLAGAATAAVFPWMLAHIFLGYRGRQAFQNMGDLGSWKDRFLAYYRLIDQYVFGGLFLPVLLLALSCVIWYIAKNGFSRFLRRLDAPDCMLAFTAAAYILIIAKIAPYMVTRYVTAVGWIYVFMTALLLRRLCRPLFKSGKERLAAVLVIAPLAVFNICAMASVHWDIPMNYTSTRRELDLAEQYADNSVVYVYDAPSPWKIAPNYLELIRYKDYVFIQPEAVEDLVAEKAADSLVLYVISSMEEPPIVDAARSAGGFASAEAIYSSYYTDVYYLEK